MTIVRTWNKDNENIQQLSNFLTFETFLLLFPDEILESEFLNSQNRKKFNSFEIIFNWGNFFVRQHKVGKNIGHEKNIGEKYWGRKIPGY